METIPQSFAKEPVFRRLAQKAKYAALTDKERKAYRESLKVYRDNYAIAETERTIGREEGRAEGRAEGLTQGIAEGIEMERRQSIRAMLAFGIPAEKIADTYRITVDEVAAIAATPE